MIRKLLLTCLIFCGIAFAQPPQEGRGPHGPGFGPMGGPHGPGGGELRGLLPPGRWWKNAEVVKAISLNDGQVQKIEQVFQDSRVRLVDAHAALEKEELKLEPLLEADSPDESLVLGAIDRIATARAAVEKANAQMAFSIRRVLTPEQWKKLRSLHPEHHGFPPPAAPPHDDDGPRDGPPEQAPGNAPAR